MILHNYKSAIYRQGTLMCGRGGMVDAQRWGRCGVKPVEVRVFSAAPILEVNPKWVASMKQAGFDLEMCLIFLDN